MAERPGRAQTDQVDERYMGYTALPRANGDGAQTVASKRKCRGRTGEGSGYHGDLLARSSNRHSTRITKFDDNWLIHRESVRWQMRLTKGLTSERTFRRRRDWITAEEEDANDPEIVKRALQGEKPPIVLPGYSRSIHEEYTEGYWEKGGRSPPGDIVERGCEGRESEVDEMRVSEGSEDHGKREEEHGGRNEGEESLSDGEMVVEGYYTG